MIGEEAVLKENYFVRFEKSEEKKDEMKPMRTLQHFQNTLNKTFTPAMATASFGQPDRKLGSGLLIFEYDLDDGTKMRLGFPGFAPLIYANHVQKDGTILVILKK